MARWQVPVVLCAVVGGLAIGLATDVGEWTERLVVPALIALLALTFAGIRRASFAQAVRPHPRTAAVSLALNFIWTPLAAGVLGWLFLSASPELRIGLVMLLVTPCTDWYLVFTATARGNVELGAALLPINLILQLVLLPLFVLALTGASTDLPVLDLVLSVVLVLGIPLGLALVARAAAGRADAVDRLDALIERSQPLGLALLAIAVAAIFATHARLVVNDPGALGQLLGPLLIFFVAAYLIATAAARRMRLAHAEQVTLTMTTMARNSPIALAVATAAFPDRPLIALALVVGPLIELPVLSVAAHLLTGRGVQAGTVR